MRNTPDFAGHICKAAPRLLIAGTGSGCGKTTVMLALLGALTKRGLDLGTFKCGPDYIDPMFHAAVTGRKGINLDLFFSSREGIRNSFLKYARDLNLIEGVMGMYDGLSTESADASSWDIACALDCPVLLVLNARGLSLSAAAMAKGYLNFRTPSQIAGLLLNQVSPSLFPRLKSILEAECQVPVLGYLPANENAGFESRHLGLVPAGELPDLQNRLQCLAETAEETVDLDALLEIMRAAPALAGAPSVPVPAGHVRLAIARDEAFCFYYQETLDFFEQLGAKLVFFSPLADSALPVCDGLYLGGGYPELHAETLSRNRSMLNSIRDAVLHGLPTLAECGGFMMLSRSIDGWPMADVLPGQAANAGKLTRFGYVTVSASEESLLFTPGDSIPGHEFHHWDMDLPGEDLQAEKPNGRAWQCGFTGRTMYAGYPHLYLPGAPGAARRFIETCLERKHLHETT